MQFPPPRCILATPLHELLARPLVSSATTWVARACRVGVSRGSFETHGTALWRGGRGGEGLLPRSRWQVRDILGDNLCSRKDDDDTTKFATSGRPPSLRSPERCVLLGFRAFFFCSPHRLQHSLSLSPRVTLEHRSVPPPPHAQTNPRREGTVDLSSSQGSPETLDPRQLNADLALLSPPVVFYSTR